MVRLIELEEALKILHLTEDEFLGDGSPVATVFEYCGIHMIAVNDLRQLILTQSD